jgi:hypothetical protein
LPLSWTGVALGKGRSVIRVENVAKSIRSAQMQRPESKEVVIQKNWHLPGIQQFMVCQTAEHNDAGGQVDFRSSQE